MQKLPIGYDNFRELIDRKLDFVDKSLFIKDILDDNATKVAVILRPRRFGKTLNISMLHYFLASEAYRQSTEGLFDQLKIAKAGEAYMSHKGKYPVIFVTFKDMKESSYASAYQSLCKLLSDLYCEHDFLLSSDKLNHQEKNDFNRVLSKTANETDIKSALKDLCKYLSAHYGIQPWLLIDEYDSPIQAAYVHGYFDEMVNLMRGLLGAVLKTNPYLNRAVITGILRVAKENLFSGVNNLEVYSVLRPEYAEYFGFTEAEVRELLQKDHLESKTDDIKYWYNGYQIGDITLYNPWSIVNCLKQKGELAPYWVNTSDNALIRTLIVKSSEHFKEAFEHLLQGNSIEEVINESMVFADLIKNEDAAWSLLLAAGYLTAVAQTQVLEGMQYSLKIPNNEVKRLYQQIIMQWLGNGGGSQKFRQFLDYLLTGKPDLFARDLKELMEQSISHHDTAKQPEAFYHGLMLGLTASLYYDPNYELHSNRESGYGRYDYLIIAKDPSKLTILLEFKKVDPAKDDDALTEKLTQAAQEALTQIDQHRYAAEAKQRGCQQILKVGLAFCGKRFEITSKSIGK